MLNYLIRISFCVFCCLCVFLYFNHYITLYYSFQFNIIIHTHGSPGWLLLISVFFCFFFLSFLTGSWFCWFPFIFILSLLLLLSPILLNMYLWISRSLLFTLLLYQLLLMFVSSRICPAACPSPPARTKVEKTCDRPLSLALCLSLCLHTIITIRRVVKLSGWRSSAGWTASQDPRTDRRRWLRRSPECTSCGSAASAGPACR